jgi:hypothetical protein
MNRTGLAWALAVMGVGCAGVFTWAAVKTYDLGAAASATGGVGDTDLILWLWLLLSMLGFAGAEAGLIVLHSNARARRPMPPR